MLFRSIKGNGKKRPLLLMGHTDTVNVDPKKWSHPPFSADREEGYIYGRGTVDDKDNVVGTLMTMLMLKRMNVPLDRDVIALFEAGEEGSSSLGIQFMANSHYDAIDAEYCFAEQGGVPKLRGRALYGLVQTSEKHARTLELVARGVSGHASVPLESNAIAHLAAAIQALARWEPTPRLNDTTRTYFEKLATISTPDMAARYNGLLDPKRAAASQKYLAENEPDRYSMLRTSVVPTMLKAGTGPNVIPSEAEATLDIRALPDENITTFYAEMQKVIHDPAVKIVPLPATRPFSPASRLDTEMYRILERTAQKMYPKTTVLPTMSTGASDMAQLRAKGIQSYGLGPATTREDRINYGPHSDVERMPEASVYKFVEFVWTAVTEVAASK